MRQSAKQWCYVVTRRQRSLDRAGFEDADQHEWPRDISPILALNLLSTYTSELDTAEKHLPLLLTCSRAGAGGGVSG